MQSSKTRLIVKNVPKHVDERRLRQHFAEKGEVSDAKIVRTKDGKSRQFAFVGFTSEHDAEEALKYYNRTFLDTSRIQVELAQPRGDAGIARPWSKHSEGSSRAQKLADERKRKDNKVNGKNNAAGSPEKEKESAKGKGKKGSGRGEAEKEEFMAALKKRSEARFWDNDDAFADQPQSEAVTGKNEDGDEDGDEDGKSGASSEDDADSLDGAEDKAGHGDSKTGREGNHNKKSETGVSDMDWLRSKVGSEGGDVTPDAADSDSDDVAEEEEEAEPSKGGTGDTTSPGRRKSLEKGGSAKSSSPRAGAAGNAADEGKDEGDDVVESGLSVGRLFVRNLPYTSTEEDLRELFETFGALSEVHLPVDDVKKGKGFAFIQFVIPEDSRKALDQLDRHAFHGRLLHIIPARRQPGASGAEALGNASAGGKSYKEQKENDRRARANDSVGWNASYVRSDTVVDALADRLGVGKGDILDRDEGDMAVRLALGETHLVKENKDYFEKEGVDISVLESAKGKGGGRAAEERSKTVILVKNLPYSTEAAELAKRFGAFGDVGRVLLPPSKAVALVEFLAPADARRAFKKLAYTRFQHVPLYLEWAPVKAFGDTFEPSSKPAALPASDKTATGEKAKVNDEEDQVAAGSSASSEPLTMFVKNLSFATTEAGLKTCFERAGLSVRSVSIPRKKGQGSSEAMLSSGFGFVECADRGLVEKALKSLQGTILDGHALELKRSTKRLTKTAVAPVDEIKRSKLIIRNVPFQATKKELSEIFSSFGQLKRVRLPKKFDGGHRGFAFVDFLTSQEALNAKNSLASTHFYGRHLVGEWAEDKEDVDTLRAKAARDVRGPGDGGRPVKKQKAGDGDDFADMDG